MLKRLKKVIGKSLEWLEREINIFTSEMKILEHAGLILSVAALVATLLK